MELGNINIEKNKEISRKEFLLLAGSVVAMFALAKVKNVVKPLSFLSKPGKNIKNIYGNNSYGGK